MNRRRGAGLLAATVLATAACGSAAATSAGGTSPGGASAAGAAVGLHGTEPTTPLPRPDFVLQDTAGQPYSFRAQTAGRPTLLFFGYTDCPDECHTAMADVAAALRSSSAALRARTRVVFVTTDPARDSGPRLRRWLDRFGSGYVGLRGTQAQVDAAQRAAAVPQARRTGPVATLPGRPAEHTHAPGTAPHKHDRPLGYGVDHTSVILAYDTSDRMPVLYPTGSSPSDIAADLPVLARKEIS